MNAKNNAGNHQTEATEEKIRHALTKIIDPDLNADIVTAGLIKQIQLEGGECKVHLELTTSACPVKDDFKRQIEEIVSGFADVKKVEVLVSARKSKITRMETNNSLQKVKTIFAVASCKGGVGKSTVAANLGLELASRGSKVGILDLDIFGPSLPILFDCADEKVRGKDKMLLPIEKTIHSKSGEDFSLLLMSFGFLLGDNAAVMRGPMVSNYMMQIFSQVNWGELDYLVLDLPPGTGDTQLTLTQRIKLDGAIMVTTEAQLSVADVARGIRMFEKVKVPLYGLVNNMAYFICDQCDKKHYLFQNKKSDLVKKLGLNLLGEIPFTDKGDGDTGLYTSTPAFQSLTDKMVRKIGTYKLAPPKAPEITLGENDVSVKFGENIFTIGYRKLRSLCPCAVCKDEYTGKRKITEDSIRQDIRIVKSEPLGNYGFSFVWNDRHSSGIYTHDYLKGIMTRKEETLAV